MLSFAISNSQQKLQIIVQTIKERWNILSPLQKKVASIALGLFAGVVWIFSVYKLHKIVRRLDHTKAKEAVKHLEPVLEAPLSEKKDELLGKEVRNEALRAEENQRKNEEPPRHKGYKGGLKDGLPHSLGRYDFGNDNYQEGEFSHGEFIKGKYVFSGNTYEGCFSKNYLNGPGKKKLKNGHIYEGNFVKDRLNGIGQITFYNGLIQRGEFQDDVLVKEIREDKLIKEIRKINWDYGVYEGEVKENAIGGYEPHGQGTLISRQINKKGEFVEGVFKKGTYIYDEKIYVGEFLNGMLTGQGTKTLKNGDVYQGGFISDRLCGEGQITYADGRVVKGRFFEDSLIAT